MHSTQQNVIAAQAHYCKCGNPITKFFSSGKPGKFCQQCRDKQSGKLRTRSNTSDAVCAQCSSPFQTTRAHQKYCSGRCRTTAHERANGSLPMAYIQPRQCPNCRQAFKPRTLRYATYCSRECAFAFMAAAPFCAVWIGECAGCSRLFTAERKRMYCSSTCHPKREWKSIAPERKSCLACGTHYKPVLTGGSVSDYCSAQCRGQVAAARKRIEKAKRKALLVAAKVEAVDPYKVFARDRWRCQMCGVKTPQSKRGTYDDEAPELDHIIPLSKGGAHSYVNTQCSCRKCNIGKAGSPRGQLLLLG